MYNRLLAFDFDGTLFDTNDANRNAYNDALAEFGYSISPDFYSRYCIGKDYKEFLPRVIGQNDEELISKIHNLKKEYYKNHYASIRINEALFDIIKENFINHKIALVTTASGSSVMDVLSFFSVVEYFDIVITKESVSRLKPDPEGYITAMKLANADPTTTIVYEDSDVGVKAGLASGANVVRISTFDRKTLYKNTYHSSHLA